MRRWITLLASFVAFSICLPIQGLAQSKGLKLGDKFEGELKTKGPTYYQENGLIYSGSDVFYSTGLPVELKAGQSITITATVTGKDRKVNIALLDPTGKPLGATDRVVKSAQLTIDEVNVKGRYLIVVNSDQIGPFTLRATAGGMEESREALEKELKEIRKRAEEIEKLLKAMDEKKK